MTVFEENDGFDRKTFDRVYDPGSINKLGQRGFMDFVRNPRKLELTYDEVYDRDRLLDGFANMHLDYKWRQLGRYACNTDMINAARWETSGLELEGGRLYSFESLSREAIAASIASGRIRALLPNYEPGVELFAKIASHDHRKEIIPGKDPLLDLQSYIEQIDHTNNAVRTMLAEASEEPYLGKYRAGPYKQHFANITNAAVERLQFLDPRLTMNALHDSTYGDPETLVILRAYEKTHSKKSADTFDKIKQLKREWPLRLGHVAETTWELDKEQVLPSGLLDIPKHIRQTEEKTCANTAFRMVFEGVTGQIIGEHELQLAVSMQHGSKLVHDEEYLKLFETSAFKDEFGVRAQSLQFMGMSIEAISSTVERLKQKRPHAKVYVVAALQSDINRQWNIQHRVLLCSANKRSVSILDPKLYGQTKIGKQEFCDRWAVTQNSGYLVIAA